MLGATQDGFMPAPYTKEDKTRGREIFESKGRGDIVWSSNAHKATGVKDTMYQLTDEDRERFYEMAQHERLLKKGGDNANSGERRLARLRRT
jgi:hypothetical protein